MRSYSDVACPCLVPSIVDAVMRLVTWFVIEAVMW